MGVCCCMRSKNEYVSNEKDFFSFMSAKKGEFDTSELNEENLKDNLIEEGAGDIELLISLIKNQSRVIIENDSIVRGTGYSWLSSPETLGDLAAIKLLIIAMNPAHNNDLLPGRIKETHLISRMMHLLSSESPTKKDASILILSEISKNPKILEFMLNKEILQKLFIHIHKLNKYKHFKEHIIASLQIMRRVYVKNLPLRKSFLELGGIQLLYECISIGDVFIIQEVLYNIEDLIYKDDEEDLEDRLYESISEMIIKEMVDSLIKLNIEKMLMDLFQDTQRNKEKFYFPGDELKRLLIIFGKK